MEQVFHVGTWTSTWSVGIYTCTLNKITGALNVIGKTNHRQHPVSLCLSKDGRFLYSADRWPFEGRVSCFEVLGPGNLEYRGQCCLPDSAGSRCVVCADDDRGLLCANGDSGDICTIYLRSDRSPGGVASLERYFRNGDVHVDESQWVVRPKSITFDRSGLLAAVPEYGSDLVYLYDYNKADLSLKCRNVISLPPGQGPCKVVFGRKQLYILAALSNRVHVYDYDSSVQSVRQRQIVSTTPYNTSLEDCFSRARDICIDEKETFLYAVNTGIDKVACFTIANGHLLLSGFFDAGGEGPCTIAVVEDDVKSHLLVCATNSNCIISMELNEKTGLASGEGKTCRLNIPTPTDLCLGHSMSSICDTELSTTASSQSMNE